MAIARKQVTTPNTLYYNKQSGKQYLMGQTVPGLYADTFVPTADAQKNGLIATPKPVVRGQQVQAPRMPPPPPGVHPRLWQQQQQQAAQAKATADLAKKGLVTTRGGYILKGNTPESLGLGTGWAPKIGHIKTNAETAIRKKTVNPLAATPAVTAGRRVNPFHTEQAPSADLFGLNLAV